MYPYQLNIFGDNFGDNFWFINFVAFAANKYKYKLLKE